MRRQRIKPMANLVPTKRKPKAIPPLPAPPKEEANENEISAAEEIAEQPPSNLHVTEAENNEQQMRLENKELSLAEEENAFHQKNETSTDAVLSKVPVNINTDEELKLASSVENLSRTAKVKIESILELKQETSIKQKDSIKNEDITFKYPPLLESKLAQSADNNTSTTIEENIIKIDLQKSAAATKQIRARVKPIPIFGSRRNSIIATSPNITDSEVLFDFAVPSATQRRERHHSNSHSSVTSSSGNAGVTITSTAVINNTVHMPVPQHHPSHKVTPSLHVGRTRTESGCSTFSDTYGSSSGVASSKSRKLDENLHRTHKREFEQRFGKGDVDKSQLKMSDLIFYNPSTNPMQKKEMPPEKQEETTIASSDNSVDTKEMVVAASAMPVPQLKLNADGELVIDDTSLVIETTADQEARKTLASSSLVYIEDYSTGMNGFYKRKLRTRFWTRDDTLRFYRCLHTIGTDFSLMCQFFPERTRRDLKLKFKKEERNCCGLVDKALSQPKQFNIDELQKRFESEDEQKRLAKEAMEKEAIVKIQKRGRSKHENALSNGDNVWVNEGVPIKKVRKAAAAANKQTPVGKRTGKKLPVSNKSKLAELVKDVEGESLTNAEKLAISLQNGFSKNVTAEEKGKEKGKENKKVQNKSNVARIDKKEKKPKAETAKERTIEEKTKKAIKTKIKEKNVKMTINIESDKETRSINICEPVAMDLVAAKEEYGTAGNNITLINLDDGTVCTLKDSEQINADAIMNAPIIITDEGADMDVESFIKKFEFPQPMVDEDNSVIKFSTEKEETVTFDHTMFRIKQQMSAPASPVRSLSSSPTPSAASVVKSNFLEYEHESEVAAVSSPSPSPSASPSASASTSTIPSLSLDCNSKLFEAEDESLEFDFQDILNQLSDGSLILVSSINQHDPDEIHHEIFKLNEATNELCCDPLPIPKEVIEAILMVLGEE